MPLPVFGGGLRIASAATVQPARLAFGLRDRVRAAGAVVHEGSRVRRVVGGPAPRVLTDSGEVRAGAVVLAVNHASAGLAPLRRALAVASSHLVLTEPVPDVLERVGWTGGECAERPPGRCSTTSAPPRTGASPSAGAAAAWRWAPGRRPRSTSTPASAPDAPRPRAGLPRPGRPARHPRLGRPDRRLPHAPAAVPDPAGGGVHAGFGFTGNGVGPTHLGGRILAALALDRREPVTRLCVVEPDARRFPPEPLRLAGGAAIRAAMVHADDLLDAGRTPGPLTRLVTSLPRRIGDVAAALSDRAGRRRLTGRPHQASIGAIGRLRAPEPRRRARWGA